MRQSEMLRWLHSLLGMCLCWHLRQDALRCSPQILERLRLQLSSNTNLTAAEAADALAASAYLEHHSSEEVCKGTPEHCPNVSVYLASMLGAVPALSSSSSLPGVKPCLGIARHVSGVPQVLALYLSCRLELLKTQLQHAGSAEQLPSLLSSIASLVQDTTAQVQLSASAARLWPK